MIEICTTEILYEKKTGKMQTRNIENLKGVKFQKNTIFWEI